MRSLMELVGWPLAITEVVALGEAGLSGILCLLLPTACDIYSRLWPGQTLELVTELKMNVTGCCLYGVCFLPQCLWVSWGALSWNLGVQWLRAWLSKLARQRSALVLTLIAV